MHIIATHVFELPSSAAPEQVWAALTRPDLTPGYFFGMVLESSWAPGEAIDVRPPKGAPAYARLRGEVLAAEEPRRLSYALDAGEGHPPTFVTWEIAGAANPTQGSVITLTIDETDPGPGDEAAPIAAWSRVTSALQALLVTLPLG